MFERLRRHLLLIAICTPVMGCGVCDDEEQKVKEEIEQKVLSELDCSGLVRQETRDLVVEALEERDFDFKQLVASPGEISEIVGAAAITTDATALLVTNIASMMQYGHFRSVLQDGWDGLPCDDTEEFECEDALTGNRQGRGSTSVVCDANGAITALSASFTDGCRVSGTENEGSVMFQRDTDVLSFSEFTLGTVKKIQGDVTLERSGGEVERFAVKTGNPLIITSNVGKDCEEKLTLREFVTTNSAAAASLALDADKESEGKVYGVTTLEDGLNWNKPLDCSCPTPGSGFDLRVPKPLGEDGTALLRITYDEPEKEGACRSARVSVVDWPTDCGVSEVVDCGKSAAEELVAPLISATCQGYAEK